MVLSGTAQGSREDLPETVEGESVSARDANGKINK